MKLMILASYILGSSSFLSGKNALYLGLGIAGGVVAFILIVVLLIVCKVKGLTLGRRKVHPRFLLLNFKTSIHLLEYSPVWI